MILTHYSSYFSQHASPTCPSTVGTASSVFSSLFLFSSSFSFLSSLNIYWETDFLHLISAFKTSRKIHDSIMISSLVFPVEGVDNEGCTLTISEDPKIIGRLVTSIRVDVIEIQSLIYVRKASFFKDTFNVIKSALNNSYFDISSLIHNVYFIQLNLIK